MGTVRHEHCDPKTLTEVTYKWVLFPPQESRRVRSEVLPSAFKHVQRALVQCPDWQNWQTRRLWKSHGLRYVTKALCVLTLSPHMYFI